MPLILTYGNKPPARGFFRLGQSIRKQQLEQIVKMQHEMFANAGESYGGIIYNLTGDGLETTSTVYGFGTGAQPISNFQPFTQIDVRHSNTDQTVLYWAAFGANHQVQVETLNSVYTIITTTAAAATSGTDQWVYGSTTITGLNADNIIGIRVSFRRLTFDTIATIRHFAAVCRPIGATSIPI